MALVKQYFGGVPSRPAPPFNSRSRAADRRAQRDAMLDPLARAAGLSHQLPHPGGARARPLRARPVLDGARRRRVSRLYQELVKKKELLQSSERQHRSRRGPDLFSFWACAPKARRAKKRARRSTPSWKSIAERASARASSKRRKTAYVACSSSAWSRRCPRARTRRVRALLRRCRRSCRTSSSAITRSAATTSSAWPAILCADQSHRARCASPRLQRRVVSRSAPKADKKSSEKKFHAKQPVVQQ